MSIRVPSGNKQHISLEFWKRFLMVGFFTELWAGLRNPPCMLGTPMTARAGRGRGRTNVTWAWWKLQPWKGEAPRELWPWKNMAIVWTVPRQRAGDKKKYLQWSLPPTFNLLTLLHIANQRARTPGWWSPLRPPLGQRTGQRWERMDLAGSSPHLTYAVCNCVQMFSLLSLFG